MSVQTYRNNRRNIPPEELAKHKGKWTAFSSDGRRIVASAAKLEVLDRLIVEAGEDPEEVVLEHLAGDEVVLGGTDFL